MSTFPIPRSTGGRLKERRYEVNEVDANGRVSCGMIGRGVPKAQAIHALLSADCWAAMKANDPSSTTECQPFLGRAAPAPGSPPPQRRLPRLLEENPYGALGFLTLAIGAAIVVRRRRER